MSFDVMFDLDGVVAQWVTRFNVWVGRPHDEQWESYSHHKMWGMDSSSFVRELERFAVNREFYHLDPHDDGVAAWNALVEMGARIHVVTHRPNPARSCTAQWLHRHGLEYSTLTFSRYKDVCVMFGCRYAIEDHVDNAVALAKAGVRTYLITRSWNEWFDCTEYDLIQRISSPMEMVESVRSIEGLVSVDGTARNG